MKFEWNQLNNSGKIMFVAFCVAVASMLLNWVNVGSVGQNGIMQGGVLFLLLWIYPVSTLLTNKKMNKVGGMVCSGLSFLLAIIYIRSKTVSVNPLMGSAGDMNFAGTGAWLFLSASAALFVGIVKYLPETGFRWNTETIHIKEPSHLIETKPINQEASNQSPTSSED